MHPTRRPMSLKPADLVEPDLLQDRKESPKTLITSTENLTVCNLHPVRQVARSQARTEQTKHIMVSVEQMEQLLTAVTGATTAGQEQLIRAIAGLTAQAAEHQEQLIAAVTRLAVPGATGGLQGENLRGLKLKIKKYTGEEDIMSWLPTMRDICSLSEVTPEQMLILYRTQMTDDAPRNEVEAFLREPHQVERIRAGEHGPVVTDLENMLIEKFSHSKPRQYYTSKLLALKQRGDQSVKEYDQDFAKILNRLEAHGHHLSDSAKKTHYTLGLHKTPRQALRDANLDSYSACRKFTSTWEDNHGIGMGDAQRQIETVLKTKAEQEARETALAAKIEACNELIRKTTEKHNMEADGNVVAYAAEEQYDAEEPHDEEQYDAEKPHDEEYEQEPYYEEQYDVEEPHYRYREYGAKEPYYDDQYETEDQYYEAQEPYGDD